LPPWINGDPSLGNYHINQFARSSQRRYLIYDHRNAIAERWQGKNRATRFQAVLPPADSVQQPPIGMRDHVGVETYIHLGPAAHNSPLHAIFFHHAPKIIHKCERNSASARLK